MNITKLYFIAILACFLISCSQTDIKNQNPYLGEETPNFVPELFGANLGSDKDNRHSALSFSPDGTELYYSVYVNGLHPQKILYSKLNNGEWSEPAVASFSGTHKDGSPLFSPDGSRIYFYSKRPFIDDTIMNDDYDIWYVDRKGNDWGDPMHLGEPINTDANENPYKFAENGDLYFSRHTKEKQKFLLKSEFVNNAFQKPYVIKELSDQYDFMKPTEIDGEDYFIYENNIKEGRFYNSYLFISYKNSLGNWTEPKNMGDMINYGEGRFPSMSPDGKYLFFVSYRTGKAQFYWVDARVIDYMRSGNLNLIEYLTKITMKKGVEIADKIHTKLIQEHCYYYRFNKDLFNNVASRLIAIDSVQKALEVYKLNIEMYPNENFYSEKLIVALLKKNEEEFKEISDLIINDTNVCNEELLENLHRAGDLFLNKSNFTEAIKIFELNKQINPNSTWPYYELGTVYYKMENMEWAIKYFEKSVAKDSSNWAAKNYLKELIVSN